MHSHMWGERKIYTARMVVSPAIFSVCFEMKYVALPVINLMSKYTMNQDSSR